MQIFFDDVYCQYQLYSIETDKANDPSTQSTERDLIKIIKNTSLRETFEGIKRTKNSIQKQNYSRIHPDQTKYCRLNKDSI